MEERERPRERACERDGEESWFQGANGDSAGYLQSGGRKRSFRIESKTFKVETEKKKGKTQIFIVERKGGVSSWIKLGPASLGPLIEGLVFCLKDTRTGHWEKLWQENGRYFSLRQRSKKGLGPHGGGAVRDGVYSRWASETKGQGQVLETHAGKILCEGGQAESQHWRRGG
ncbi:hypothetical protein CK203_107042 [Vitis vinifera]|uniref:Uncharacterized protein n=1 Tax=Vitis vinifera TaxID=29760 RepID=A0A438EJ49_VITVI|nr:hypothetical protein CK203_107042 [Vitis vinifera]